VYEKQMLKGFITKIILICLLTLILFPFPIAEVFKYKFMGAYVALIFSFFLLPAVFFLNKSYWGNKFTIGLWFLRILALLIFLIVTPREGLTQMDLIPFIGAFIMTFFYEVGYFITTIGYFEKFLKYWMWLNVFICVYVFIIVVPIFLRQGYIGVINSMDVIRNYYPSWPNHFGIYLVLLFWVIMYFRSHNKNYALLFILIFSMLFLTSSRTAFLALAVSIVFALYINRKKRSVVSVLSVLGLLTFSGYVIFTLKSMGGFGSSLEHTIAERQFRWVETFYLWKQHPFTGYGFRSFTEIVPYYFYEGKTLIATGSSHNDYIDLLLRGGLFYSIGFWTFILLTVWQSVKSINQKSELLKHLSYCTIVLLISAFFQNPFKNPIILAYFWSYIAFVAIHTNTNILKLKKPQ